MALLLENGGGVRELSVDLIHRNDLIKILPATKIPMDGVVVEGSSTVNQASVTGESMPIEKQVC
jgi:P-type E1-E2 ATPase